MCEHIGLSFEDAKPVMSSSNAIPVVFNPPASSVSLPSAATVVVVPPNITYTTPTVVVTRSEITPAEEKEPQVSVGGTDCVAKKKS